MDQILETLNSMCNSIDHMLRNIGQSLQTSELRIKILSYQYRNSHRKDKMAS